MVCYPTEIRNIQMRVARQEMCLGMKIWAYEYKIE